MEVGPLARVLIGYGHGREEFTEIVKLEPFRRALKEHNPEIWFTNIRVRQTQYRNYQDI